MSIRVNPNIAPDLLADLSTAQRQQDTSLQQLASGRRVNQPSDDPAASAELVINHDLSSQADSFQSNATNISGQQQTADSTLSSVVIALQRAITLGIQGANSGVLSDTDRQAVVQELKGVQSQLLSLANTSYQGRFLFSGTEQAKAPYALDSTRPSGVRYDGNAGVNTVTIGNGYQLQVNLPGSQLFSSPQADVFQSITDLITAVSANSGTDTAVAGARRAFDYVTSQRVFYGNGLNQIQAQQTFLDGQKTQLSSQENALVGADLAATASNLANAATARQATLAAIGKAAQNSLFDFLK